MAEWQPQTEVTTDEWRPQTERVPVKTHTRRPRTLSSALGQIAGVASTPLGPLSIPIAQAAGAAGEQLQQGMELGLPTITPFGAIPAGSLGTEVTGELPNPTAVLAEGNKQGALQGAGLGLAAGATKLSKPLMELAVKATPEVAQTAIREGIAVTQAGRDKVLAKLGQYGNVTRDIVTKASLRLGKSFNSFDMAKQAFNEIYPKVATSMTGEEAQMLRGAFQKFMEENPIANVTASKLHKLKQTADTAARAIHNLPVGVQPSPAQEAVAGFYESYANKAREALNRTVQGYEQSNAPTEALIKLKNAIVPLTKKEMSTGARILRSSVPRVGTAAAGAAIGAAAPGNRLEHGLIGAGLGAAVGVPNPSTMALGLNSPLLQLLLQRIPGLAGNAIQ